MFVVYAGTRNQYHQMVLAAKSLLAWNDVKVKFLIEDDKFPETLDPAIECINVRDQYYFREDGPNYNQKWTYMTLMRLAFPLMFPDEDRILWLDNDTFIKGDITPLLNTEMKECVAAAVVEYPRCIEPFLYFNAGVLLMDPKRINGQELVDYINKHKLRFPDQDCINILLQGKILPLSEKWNASQFTGDPPDSVIVHYAGANKAFSRMVFGKYENKEWRQK